MTDHDETPIGRTPGDRERRAAALANTITMILTYADPGELAEFQREVQRATRIAGDLRYVLGRIDKDRLDAIESEEPLCPGCMSILEQDTIEARSTARQRWLRDRSEREIARMARIEVAARHRAEQAVVEQHAVSPSLSNDDPFAHPILTREVIDEDDGDPVSDYADPDAYGPHGQN